MPQQGGTPSNPLGLGIADFLQSFAGEAEKQSTANRQQKGREALERLRLEYEDKRDANKKDLAEDPNKVRPQNNPNGPQSLKGTHADPKLMAARKYLTKVSQFENDWDKFKANAMLNPVYAQEIAQNMGRGMDRNSATGQVFQKEFPDKYGAMNDAHHGQIAHLLQTYPNLAQEYPNYGSAYGTPLAASGVAAPGASAAPAPASEGGGMALPVTEAPPPGGAPNANQ